LTVDAAREAIAQGVSDVFTQQTWNRCRARPPNRGATDGSKRSRFFHPSDAEFSHVSQHHCESLLLCFLLHGTGRRVQCEWTPGETWRFDSRWPEGQPIAAR